MVLVLPGTLFAQSSGSPDQAAMIRNALSAAPASVAEGATVMDFNHNTLREGSNGWVCMPDMPDVPNNSPMCLDRPWLEVIDAWMNKRAPTFEGIGFGYMLQGDMPVSNKDPFATGPSPDNQWVANSGPHIMMVISDQALLKSLPTDPENGGPWVMWKGTPYAHVMIPTERRQQ
ncbi:MAG: hypothetical protein H0U67_09440 [Gemmatimonadetes bacterium]|nr:hypothetical protein [Gemmatimonadota bacterium]